MGKQGGRRSPRLSEDQEHTGGADDLLLGGARPIKRVQRRRRLLRDADSVDAILLGVLARRNPLLPAPNAIPSWFPCAPAGGSSLHLRQLNCAIDGLGAHPHASAPASTTITRFRLGLISIFVRGFCVKFARRTYEPTVALQYYYYYYYYYY
jgi:hypothetical protein